MAKHRGKQALRVAAALGVGLVLLLTGCGSDLEVTGKTQTPPNDEGLRTYTVGASGATTGRERRYIEIARPDDDWVRHCFDSATRGDGVPYFCTAGRTPFEARLGFASILAAAALTWTIGLVAVGQMPAAAPVEPVPAGSWLFRRTAVEKRAYRPIWREQLRLALTGYPAKVAAVGVVGGVLFPLVLALPLGLADVRDWALVGGLIHIVGFTTAFGIWGFTQDVVNESTRARLMLGIGAGVGLFTASGVIDRFLAFRELA